jgi:hypothetical protein
MLNFMSKLSIEKDLNDLESEQTCDDYLKLSFYFYFSMTQKYKFEELLSSTFQNLGRGELKKLETYIAKHNLGEFIHGLKEKPKRKYREAELE